MALAIRIFSAHDWSSKEKGREFCRILATHGEDLVLAKFGPYGQARYSFSSQRLAQVLEFWACPPAGSLGFYAVRRRPLDVRVWVQWYYRENQRHNELNLWLDRDFLKGHANALSLATLARDLYLWGTGDYGYAVEEVVLESRLGPKLERGLPGIYWANFFGPIYVEFFGRGKFNTVPAFYKEELVDGGFLLLTAPSPFEHNHPRVQALAEAIIDHLGRDAFFEKSRPEKVCRTPRFNFRQAPLGHPIAVVAEDPVPKAIPDPHQFIRDVPLLAEKLIHRLKAKLDYSADSLRKVDEFVLRESHRRPNPWDREADRQLIQELTAYYGEVIRRQLGGKWVAAEGSSGALHPALTFTVDGIVQLEYPFTRVIKLWEERQRADALAIHFMLMASGEWGRLEQYLRGLQ